MTEPMLALKGLTAGYHGGTVLHSIDLRVDPGEVHAIVGHNGAGKSTMLSTIAGLVSASGGRIEVDGEDVAGLPSHRRARRGVGYVPQGRRVFASVTVAEHLAISHRRGADWTPARVLELLPRLAERRRHKGGQLSGGEQQMLAIARALLTGPRLLLLDEPTEGLAPAIVAQIRATIVTLAAGGMTILLAAPQPEWPLEIADRVSVLSAGKLTVSLNREQMRTDASVVLSALSMATRSEAKTAAVQTE